MGKKANGDFLPTYAESTLKRKKRYGRLYGDGEHWSLKETGGFHRSIVVINGVPSADFKRGISLLLSSRGITTKQILGF